MSNKVFNRVEKKYLITEEDKKQLSKVVKAHMHKDNYHKSEVFNLYFDTNNYDLIIQSIEQPIFKEKLRARSYGGYDRVFLEIKTKLRGKDANPGFKRRVMLTKNEFKKFSQKNTKIVDLISQKSSSPRDLQIAKEIDYLFHHFVLHPKILVIYDRTSYQGEDRLRVTFDENLKYREQNLSFTKTKHDKIYFEEEPKIILEIKGQNALPLWLVKELSKLKIFPQQFSKIGKIYEKIRKEPHV